MTPSKFYLQHQGFSGTVKWNNSKDLLPDTEKTVLVVYNGQVTIGYITDWGKWRALINMSYEEPVDYDCEIEYWQDLPDAP